MAGKGPILMSRPLAYAMDGQFSKNALIDLVVDRARAELGEDATDDQVAALVEEWARPVAQARGDKPVNVAPRLKHWYDARDEHIRRQTPHKCVHSGCESLVTGGDLCMEHSRAGFHIGR